MKVPCTAAEKIKQLHPDEVDILRILCGEIETGVRSSDLQEQVNSKRECGALDKATFYKRLQRLNEEVNIIERVPYKPGKGKDRREVHYRVKPECVAYCQELITGFDVRQFISRTEFRSIVCNEENADCIQRIIRSSDSGLRNPIGISVFTSGELDPKPVSSCFRTITKADFKVISNVFHGIIEGMKKDKNEVRIALVFHYPFNQVTMD